MRPTVLQDYSCVQPIVNRIAASRQAVKRHYGVHPYFTRRAPNVVRSYISHYSRPGDRVLDPFGGSGVTAIEAILSCRNGIHNDINPLGNFIAEQIADVSHAGVEYIRRGLDAVDSSCGKLVRTIPQMSDCEVLSLLSRARLPKNIRLPRSSDVEHFHDLFTPRQLLALARLKEAIDELRDISARNQLLLAWSATLGKLNRTFLSAKGRAESRGGSSIFSIYRYKVAKRPVELHPWEVFVERIKNVIAAKEEILKEKRYLEANGHSLGSFELHARDVLSLPEYLEPVDYIFTDPPYGGHIAYLDLSTIWNHWLGFKTPAELRKSEIIVGGEIERTEEEYVSLLKRSIRACVEMLKQGRWLSVVFQHWNTRYFEAILETAESSGASLRAAVTQVGDTVWSMHKKKNLERVLGGEMILTFFKGGMPRRRPTREAQIDIGNLVDAILPQIAKDNGVIHGEALFNRLITEAWNRNALAVLRIRRDDFLRLLHDRGWRYDSRTHCWRKGAVGVQARLHF